MIVSVFRRVLTVSILLALLSALAHAQSPLPRLRVEGGALLDSDGRTVLLRGVNVGKKNPPFLPDRAEADYAALERWGLNCVRFYINWEGIEPEPGVYDDALLARFDQQIGWANRHGVYVLIDLHQDLWGGTVPGGNGAPGWATLDDGKPHMAPDGNWGAAYFTSQQVIQSFESFWSNRPGPGGVGLQDRFAAMARHVAERYKNNPGVVGIDLMNEPGNGFEVQQVQEAIVAALPKLAALPDPPQGLLAAFTGSNTVDAFMRLTERKDIYEWGLGALAPVVQRFAAERLEPFYDRAGQAIREVTPDTLIFFEPPGLANSGAPAGMRPPRDADGNPLRNQVYAPHIYDLVTDSPNVDKPSPMRLDIMFDHVAECGAAMSLPVVIGEWGGYYGNGNAEAAAQYMAAHFQHSGFGDLYWDYESNLRDKVYFNQICRPYPMAVGGKLTAWDFDEAARTVHLAWETGAGIDAPTQVYLPRVWYAARPVVRGAGESQLAWRELSGEDGGWQLEIKGKPGAANDVAISSAP